MPNKIIIFISCLVLGLFWGCVSQEKYRELEMENSRIQKQMQEDKEALYALQVQNAEFCQNAELLNENKKLQKEIDELKLKLTSEKPDDGQTEKVTSKSTPATNKSSGQYSILLSSCQQEESVKKVLSDCKENNIEAFVVKVDLGEKGIWWRIFTGHYETREMAAVEKNNKGLGDKIVLKSNVTDAMLAQEEEKEAELNKSLLLSKEL